MQKYVHGRSVFLGVVGVRFYCSCILKYLGVNFGYSWRCYESSKGSTNFPCRVHDGVGQENIKGPPAREKHGVRVVGHQYCRAIFIFLYRDL